MQQYQHRWLNGAEVGLPAGKAVCVGKNYADHIKEMKSATPDQPVLFIKPPAALCSADQDIRVSHLQHLGEMHHELEIALLIGQTCSGAQQDPTAVIAGIGLGIDLTLRDVQAKLKKQGLPWERSKAFDGSCVLSRFIEPDDKYDLQNLTLELQLNGQVRQQSNSSLMLTPIKALIDEITTVFTLEPGDIVLTGTPAGVGPLLAGDVISARFNELTLIEKTNVI